MFSLVSNEVHSSGSDVLLGKRNIRVDAEYGSIILEDQDEWPRPHPREPRRLLPRQGQKLIDRKGDLRKIKTALSAGRAVEIVWPADVEKHCVAGVGLRVDRFWGGGGVPRRRRRDVEDVVQDLFEACFDSAGYRPGEVELRGLMAGVRVHVLIDDLSCSAEQLRVLFAAAQDTTVVWTSNRPFSVRGVVELGGLSLDAAKELLVAELGDQEPAVLAAVWRVCYGHPLEMLRLAALVRWTGRLPGQNVPDVALSSAVFAEVVETDEGTRLGTRLVALGLLTESNEQFRHAPGVAARLPEGSRLGGAALGAVATRLVSWLTRAAPQAVAGQVTLVAAVVEALTESQPDLAVRVARAAAPLLARSARSGGWRRVLDAGRSAAERSGDRSAEAYFRHEAGIRSLGLGDVAAAAAQFTAAAALWQQPGDSVGAGVTLQAQSLASASAAVGAPAMIMPATVTIPGAAATGAAAAAGGATAVGATSVVTATVIKIAAVCVLVPGTAYAGNEYVAPVRKDLSKAAELLVLRHENAVLRRQIARQHDQFKLRGIDSSAGWSYLRHTHVSGAPREC